MGECDGGMRRVGVHQTEGGTTAFNHLQNPPPRGRKPRSPLSGGGFGDSSVFLANYQGKPVLFAQSATSEAGEDGQGGAQAHAYDWVSVTINCGGTTRVCGAAGSRPSIRSTNRFTSSQPIIASCLSTVARGTAGSTVRSHTSRQ